MVGRIRRSGIKRRRLQRRWRAERKTVARRLWIDHGGRGWATGEGGLIIASPSSLASRGRLRTFPRRVSPSRGRIFGRKRSGRGWRKQPARLRRRRPYRHLARTESPCNKVSIEVAFTEIEIPFFCNVSDDLLQRFDGLIGLLFLLFSACSKTRGRTCIALALLVSHFGSLLYIDFYRDHHGP